MATSPSKFNGELDHFFDPNFTEEISQKMQVPKRIKVNGENEDDIVIGVGGNQPISAWQNDKIDMHVPDRILVVDAWSEVPYSSSKHVEHWSQSALLLRKSSVAGNKRRSCRKHTSLPVSDLKPVRSDPLFSGHDEHFGTRGTPLETSHENAVLRTETGRVRVQTPPRVITLSDHYFPSADDFPPPELGETPPSSGFVRPKGRLPDSDGGDRHRNDLNGFRSMDTKNESFATPERYRMQPLAQFRDGTPPLTDGMTANEEIAHLRRQLAKLNRRVMSIELENLQRQQYEKIACALSIGYIVWKTLLWLRGSS